MRGATVMPELGEGAHDAVFIGVEGALVPALPAGHEVGEISDGVKRGAENALLPAALILVHEVDVATTFDADFFDELGEAGGAGEIDVGVWLEAVAVAAGDDEVAGVAGQGWRSACFRAHGGGR